MMYLYNWNGNGFDNKWKYYDTHEEANIYAIKYNIQIMYRYTRLYSNL